MLPKRTLVPAIAALSGLAALALAGCGEDRPMTLAPESSAGTSETAGT
jgi:hypothetical protein